MNKILIARRGVPLMKLDGINIFIAQIADNLISKGYIFEDFKKVIDLKWNEWKGTKFQQYVRPATIFGNKFETYLNEQSPSQIKLTKLHNNVEKAKRTNWRLDKE